MDQRLKKKMDQRLKKKKKKNDIEKDKDSQFRRSQHRGMQNGDVQMSGFETLQVVPSQWSKNIIIQKNMCT